MLQRLRQFAIYALAILIAIGMGLSIPFGIGELIDAVQAQPVQVATVEISDNCEVFATVGDTKLYRCIDEDYGPICYLNPLAAGIIDCVEY